MSQLAQLAEEGQQKARDMEHDKLVMGQTLMARGSVNHVCHVIHHILPHSATSCNTFCHVMHHVLLPHAPRHSPRHSPRQSPPH